MDLPITVGIEIETNQLTSNLNNDMARIRERFTAAGINWNVKYDSSCGTNDGFSGLEVVSTICSTTQDLENVKKVCNILKDVGCKVNQRCGLHVHLGIRCFSEEQHYRMLNFFLRHEDAFFFLEPSRKDSRYCGPISQDIKEKFMRGIRVDGTVPTLSYDWGDHRYTWMNGCAFRRHGTLEFRLMSGSLNEDDILNWVWFLLTCASKALRTLPSSNQENSVFLAADKLLQESEYDISNSLKPLADKARKWAKDRLNKWQENISVDQIRDERRRRLRAAWRGDSRFEPIYTTNQRRGEQPVEAAVIGD
jgi:hypothetical protein